MLKLTVLLSVCVYTVSTAYHLNAPVNSSCQTPNKQNGTCIALRDCPELYTLLTQVAQGRTFRYSTETKKFLGDTQCGFIDTNGRRPNHPLVCCRTYETPQIVTDHPHLPLINAEGCGKHQPDRIYGGDHTGLKDFRWMALLGYRTDDSPGNVFVLCADSSRVRFECGGTVISDRYVLTAAHCVSGTTPPVVVRLGEHNLANSKEDKDCEQTGPFNPCNDPPQEINIEEIIVHPSYLREQLINDIALIRLNGTANLQRGFISTICLPVGTEQQTMSLDEETTTVTGWGATETGSRSSNVLLQVKLPVVNNDQCNAVYKTLHNRDIGDGMMCAGGGDHQEDSCNGDSGGPLMVSGVRKKSFVQFGIVSYGPRRCGTAGVPGVYTRVSHYIKWILDNMRLEGTN